MRFIRPTAGFTAIAATIAAGLMFSPAVYSWGSHQTCAYNSGYYGNYAERNIGPHWTHFPQWSSDHPYYARRKNPANGDITYSVYVSYGAFDVHFDADHYRYTGLKNADGAAAGSAFWYAAHMTGYGC